MAQGTNFVGAVGLRRANLDFVQKNLEHFTDIAVNLHVMPLLIPYFRQQPFTEPPAMVHVVAREDVQWNRKLFKAPPLNVKPPVLELGPVGANLRKFPAAVSKPVQTQ